MGFSALSSTIFAGLLVGNLLGGYLSDYIGRRATMIGVNIVFCVFGLLSAAAPDIYVFAISRFFTGIGIGSMVPPPAPSSICPASSMCPGSSPSPPSRLALRKRA